MAVECIFSWCWLADLCAPGLWLALKRNQKLTLRRMGIAVTLQKGRQLFFLFQPIDSGRPHKGWAAFCQSVTMRGERVITHAASYLRVLSLRQEIRRATD